MDSSVEIAKFFSDAEKLVDKEIAEELMDATNFVDVGLGVGVYLFEGVEMRGSGSDMGQSTSNDDAHDAHDAHDDNDNQTIDRRRRRDDGDDDGGGGDDGSRAQVGRPKYPIGVLGKRFDDDDDNAQQRRRRATTTTSDDDDIRHFLQRSVAKSRAVADGGAGLTPHGPKSSREPDMYAIGRF